MTPLAVVVLAHDDPEHVRRLVAALDDLPVVLHCDAGSSAEVFGRMTRGLPARVTVLPRTRTTISSWSLVAAELRALREALAWTRAEHIAVLTGSDYPLVPVQEILEVLAGWAGCSYIYNIALPFPQWSTRRHPDGGFWRFRYRFFSRRGQLLTWGGIPLHWPVPRSLPAGLRLRASTQWKVFSREHAELLLRLAETRPELLRFWRTTLIPEESFAASVLATPTLAGSSALRPCRANAWYYDFRGEDHPKWLVDDDFGLLTAAREAPALTPAAAFADSGPVAPPHGKLFARKFSSTRSAGLLDRIDAELRG